jgi:hypothetical protein
MEFNPLASDPNSRRINLTPTYGELDDGEKLLKRYTDLLAELFRFYEYDHREALSEFNRITARG